MEIAVATDKLIDIIPTTKPRPRPVEAVKDIVKDVIDSVKPIIVKPSKTDKEKITEILSVLETVRLNMADSAGQGFLFNAAAGIRLYLNNSNK